MADDQFDEAESSSQALERYISTQLKSLDIATPQDDIEMMARFLEEEGMEDEDKIDGVKALIEGLDPEAEAPPEADLDNILRNIIDESTRLKEIELNQLVSSLNIESPEPQPPETAINPKEEGDKEKEALRAHALRYAYLEGQDEDYISPEDQVKNALRNGAPPKRSAASEAELKKQAEERKAMVEAALKLDAKKKKYKKQQEVDLLAPNLNRDKVQMRAQMEREAQKKSAQAIRERDKAALDKQRADAAKAKAEKQKKAAKQERRG